MLRIAITGVTGLLGRNFLFEIVKNNLSRLNQLEIYVLGRSSPSGKPLDQRIREILVHDGMEYLEIPEPFRNSLQRALSRVIRFVDDDLDSTNNPARFALPSGIDWFFHVASLTDLKSSSATAAALRRTNVEGTRKVLDLAARAHVREFCYVGTAYVCGETSGAVAPDFLDTTRRFRNPYERSKCDAELLVRRFAQETGMRCRYFRPSTVSGRLLEQPRGAVCNFDVFYGWAAFFHRLQQQSAWSGVPGDLRVCYSRTGGLNIVPVDYLAKAMYLVCDRNDPGESYHLASHAETPYRFFVPQMLDALGIRWVSQTDSVPVDQTKLESLYYRSVGAIYTPYVTSGPMNFDTSNLRPFLERHGLKCPDLDASSIAALMDCIASSVVTSSTKAC